jgi:hypothetical protein
MKAPMRMQSFFAHLDAKRALALVLGPSAAAIGGDAAIAHFAGRDMAHPAQLLPVLVAPLACLALMAVAAPRLPGQWFRRGARAVGAVLAALGMVGTGFHGRALARLLEGSPRTWENLKTALAVAPPLFAPGAFIMLGALVFVLGSPRVRIELQPAAPIQLARAA